ncbi:MAG: helix-hairpin-helix domain-containing protein [Desulfobulbaceae bacterium]|nr:helix-hairpin-helix domain-containing protein [Desulfobulbaceae bacterium]
MSQAPIDDKKDKRLLVLLILGCLIIAPHLHPLWDDGSREHGDAFLWIAEKDGDGRFYIVPASQTHREFLHWCRNTSGCKDGERLWKLLSEEGSGAVGPNGIESLAEGADPRLLPLLGQPIPINRADAETIAMVPGIGPTLAERIVQFRSRHEKILNSHMLLEVPGIGPVLASKCQRYFTFD